MSPTTITWGDLTLYGTDQGDGSPTFSTLEGWAGRPDTRSAAQSRPHAHGAFDAPRFSAARMVTVGGWCHSPQDRDVLFARFDEAMILQRDLAPLVIDQAGQVLSAQARLVGYRPVPGVWGAGFWRWSAQWECPDPFRYAPPSTATTGFVIDRSGLMFDLFTDGSGRENLVTNPRGRDTSGTVTVADNLAHDPDATDLASWESNQSVELVSGWGDHASAVRAERASTGTLRVSVRGTYEAEATYTVRVHVRASQQLTSVRLYLRASVTTGAGPTALGTYTIPAGESTITVTETTTSDTPSDNAGLAFLYSSGSVGSTLDVTGVQITPGDGAGPFLSGDTWDGDPDFTPEWEDEPHESPSRLVAPNPVGWASNNTITYYSQTRDCLASRILGGSVAFARQNVGNRQGLMTTVLSDMDSTGPVDLSVYYGSELPDSTRVDGLTVVRWVGEPANTNPWGYGWRMSTVEANAAAGQTVYWRSLIRRGAYDGPPCFEDQDTGFLEFSDPGEDTGIITLTNPGTADAWPVHVVAGPVPDAGFELRSAGRTVRYARGVPSGSTLVLDTGAGTAELDGADVSQFVTLREWTPVPPKGSLDVLFHPVEGTSAAQLTTTVRPAFW